jgi:GTP pyrophosphokinase
MLLYSLLLELSNENLSSEEYNAIVRSDILTRMIYLEGINGVNLELPEGSTPVDYAFNINPLSANYIDYALVNGRWSPINYPLESRDKIEIIYGKNERNPEELINSARCMQTKRKIIKK